MVYMNSNSIKPDSTHILADFRNCDANTLIKSEVGETIVKRAVNDSGLCAVDVKSYQFQPQGYTVAALLTESHITLHSWPEYNSVQIDIFTCSSHEKCRKAYLSLKKAFNPKDVAVKCFMRNLETIVEEDI